MQTIIDVYHQNLNVQVNKLDNYHPDKQQDRFNLSIRDIINGHLDLFNGITLNKCQRLLREKFQT